LMLSQIRKCDLSFVLSDYMKHNLLMNKWHASKIVKLIPNATLQEDNTTVNNEIPIVLYVGQLIRGKGIDLAIKALSRVSEPFKFVVLGRGNDENYLKELSAQLLPGKAEFLGWAADVNQIYAGADIVVVPSRWQEPFGLVGLEAFSKAKPVVAFDIGGISEWLKHKVNGLLVYPGDSGKLAMAISSLLKNPELRQRYGKAGLELCKQHFNQLAYTNSLLQPLQKLIKPTITFPGGSSQ
ncbi:MAG: glycosyltransferase family 4 protein, partial [Candidatus Cloacimonetes bacterium]|nr:glycosyltransferase family 4 protein [Candidatus Cloacimonadota bacterium]